MNKFFFALLFLAFLVFEVKSDWDDIISPEILEKINKLIHDFHDKELWNNLIHLLRNCGADTAIQWCSQFETYAVCEALIDDYLDY